MHFAGKKSLYGLMIAALAILSLSACKEEIEPDGPRTISSLKFIGEQTIAANSATDSTTVGGLSSIDYDGNNTWYLISDDQGSINPPRFYTANINLSETAFSGVTITGTIPLKQTDNTIFSGGVDPEAIRFDSASQRLFWTSEGNRNSLVQPFIREMELNGNHVRDFNIPAIFTMDTTQEIGPRQNGVFEGLTLSADGTELVAMMELPLFQDGPAPTVDPSDSPARMVFFNKASGNATKQFAYMLDPVKDDGAGFKVNGVVEILSVSDSIYLVMERSFTAGVRNYVSIYKVDITGATDISGISALTGATYTPVQKNLLLTVNDLTLDNPVDNIEGISWGPKLPNGNYTLLLVSDDNFSLFDPQVNQFLAFEVMP